MFKHPLFKQILPLMATLLLAVAAVGQSTCTYSIKMFENYIFGNGWQGGTLTVVSNGVTTTHTLVSGFQGTSSFQVIDGAAVTISWSPSIFFSQPSFELLDPDGILITSVGDPLNGFPIPVGVVYDAIGQCPNCPAPNIALFTVPPAQITETTAYVNWASQSIAEYFIVEYGPSGFPLGAGLTIQTTASEATLTGLNPCVEYDVYLASFCGVDSTSSLIGPKTFTTDYNPSNPGITCDYTFNLFDGFGDGWDAGALQVMHNGNTYNYTISPAQSTQATYTLTAISNLPIKVTYIPSVYPNEVTYEILDPTGSIIFSDGPYPQNGEVFNTIACPTCPGPVDAWMSDVNATNARFAWQPSPNAAGNYIIEYGPMGFTLGTGIVDTVPVGQLLYNNLTGLAENSWYNVYIKLDCGTEFSKPLGPVMFKTLRLNDLGVSAISMPTAADCDLGTDEEVTVLLTNYGQAPQTLFEFYFAVNGQIAPIPVPQDGLFTGVLGNDSTQVISFETTWDFSEPGVYILEAWTVLDGDSQPSNDTFRTEIITAYPKPLKENFEDNQMPDTWTTTGAIYGPNAHNNPTYVMGTNLYSFNPLFEMITYRVGPVETGDTLKFDYRYVNWSAGTTATVLSATDNLRVQVSDNCQDTWQTVLTINSTNHVTSTDFATKTALLNAFDGEAINVRFLGTWGAGDYWLDIDNINITGCPEALYLLGNVHGSLEGESNGSIDLTVYLTEGPFTYAWVDESTGQVISTEEDPSGLPVGTYSVSVTSADGCTGFKTFVVGIFVGASEVDGLQEINLYPNPTAGTAFVDIKMLKNMDVQLRLLNLNGQVVFEAVQTNASDIHQELDLSNQAPGMYILQVIADGKPYHAKLMVAR